MRKSGSKVGFIAMALFWAGWIAFSSVSHATLPIQKKAKELGYPATNCQYCHVEKLPKKGAVSHNERGKWLYDDQQARKLKAPDLEKLKDFPGGKEQK